VQHSPAKIPSINVSELKWKGSAEIDFSTAFKRFFKNLSLILTLDK
jgi:hypothetical protein